jgi:hypothetical protein
MILQPTLNKIGSLPEYDEDTWLNEPLLHRASYDFAINQGGIIIQDFIKYLPITNDNKNEWIIDLRFHYLKENELPAIDCWHLDFFNLENKNQKIYLACLGNCSLTEVITSKTEISISKPFVTWNEEVQKQNYSSVIISPGAVYQYTAQTLHKATPALEEGVRIFMRACHMPHLKPQNKSPDYALLWQIGDKTNATHARYVR